MATSKSFKVLRRLVKRFIGDETPESKDQLEQLTIMVEAQSKLLERLYANRKPLIKEEGESKLSFAVLNEFQNAYRMRYQVDTLITEKVKGMALSIGKLMGEEEAIELVHAYLKSDNPYYVKNGHSMANLWFNIERIGNDYKRWKKAAQVKAIREKREKLLEKPKLEQEKML